MSDVRLKKGDEKPHLSATLDGGPTSWAGATAAISIAPAGGTATLYSSGFTFDTGAKTVEWDWTGFDTTVVGEYHYEWIITFPDTDEMTAPGVGFDTFYIVDSFAAPAGNCYCSLSDLKNELGITSNDEDDRLIMFIEVASRQVDNICRQSFYHDAAIVETYAFQGYPRMILKHKPLISITTIEDTDGDVDTTVDASNYEIENAGAGIVWFHSLLADDSYRFNGVQQPTAMRRARYKVTYAAGYETPNQTNTGATSLPGPIRYATVRLAAALHNRQGVDPRVQREHLLEASVWYSDRQFQEEVESLLRPYRAPVMV
jgi:hypothetical protein